MYNCDIFADVDFGHGPVEIRCTKTGEHTKHSCNVYIGTIKPEPQANNVFDGEQTEI